MTEKATIVLGNEVRKKIKWFTEHYENEIGAVGIGGIKTFNGKKCFYVEKLLFPKQEVTGATVHIEATGWADIIKELELKELGKIMFYWHRHPGGSPHRSSTDEEDTFGTFMADEAKRKHFVFLQTAWKDGKVVREARIDIRNPIRFTITDENIELLYEKSVEEDLLEKECKKIIEEKVKVKTYEKPAHYYGKGNGYYGKDTGYYDYGYGTKEDDDRAEVREAIEHLINNEEDYIDNDLDREVEIPDEKKVSILFNNGEVQITTKSGFEPILKKALDEELKPLVRRIKKVTEKDRAITYRLQPSKKAYDKLKKGVKQLFVEYQKKLRKELKNTKENEDISEKITALEGVHRIIAQPELISDVIKHLVEIADIDWRGPKYGFVKSLEQDVYGTILLSKDDEHLTVTGKELVGIIQNIEQDIYLKLEEIDDENKKTKN